MYSRNKTALSQSIQGFPFSSLPLLIVKFLVDMEGHRKDCIHWAFAVHFLITYNWLYITLNINGKNALYFSSNYYP